MSQPTQPPPRVIKTLGTLNLVFAGLGLLGGAMTYAMYFGGLKIAPGPDPLREAALGSPAYMSFLRVSMVAGFIASLVLGASGIGLHRMKEWGRKAALAYAVYAIVGAIAGIVMLAKYVLPALSKLHGPAAQGGVIGGMMGGVIAISYPIVILVFMNRRNVREAFARANEPPVPPAQLR
ncbi:MAG TPA: hypothetical protein VMZ53_34360 [Kofleriaceae bacterium]|nr:hypothetical protein [Kofleriaceae bacterium]